MKKLLLLTVLIMALILTACTSSGDTSVKEEDKESSEKGENAVTTKAEMVFDEMVAVSNDLCSVKLVEIDPDNMWGYTIKAELENKSSDKTYMFSVDGAYINGVQCDPFFASEVASGKKANESIHFSDSDLEKNNIGEYTDIEITFKVYDSDDWQADDVAYETVHVYPYGEENAVKYTRAAKDTDTVLLDNEYATVIVTDYEQDEIWGYSANVFILNKSDKNLMISVDEASVNGFMADPYFSTSISAGKCKFDSISWSETTFEENGIESVEEISFILNVSDYDEWLEDDYANETIVLNP